MPRTFDANPYILRFRNLVARASGRAKTVIASVNEGAASDTTDSGFGSTGAAFNSNRKSQKHPFRMR